MEYRRGAYPTTGRGGKGFEAVKRTKFVRVIPPAIELVDWDQVEGKAAPKEKPAERNGDGKDGEQKGLFE